MHTTAIYECLICVGVAECDPRAHMYSVQYMRLLALGLKAIFFNIFKKNTPKKEMLVALLPSLVVSESPSCHDWPQTCPGVVPRAPYKQTWQMNLSTIIMPCEFSSPGSIYAHVEICCALYLFAIYSLPLRVY